MLRWSVCENTLRQFGREIPFGIFLTYRFTPSLHGGVASGNSLGGVLTFADYGDGRIENGGNWGQVVGEYDTNRIWFFGINYNW